MCLNFFPHFSSTAAPPSHLPSLSLFYTKKRKSTHVLHSRHELKYAVLIALSLVTMAADQTHADRNNYTVSIVQFNNQHFDLQPCLLIFSFFLLRSSHLSIEKLPHSVGGTYTSTISPVWPHSRTASASFFLPQLSSSYITHPSPLSLHWIIPPPPNPFSFLR